MRYTLPDGGQLNVYIERSRRRTIVISVSPKAEIILKLPLHTTDEEVKHILSAHRDWIRTHVEQVQSARKSAENVQPLTMEELRKLTAQAARYIPTRVAVYAAQLQVSYGRITIRHQRTRWGSCSMKGNLNFNCLLMEAPPEVLDYVVVHELCHRLEMNHGPRFWALVEQVLPGYREQKTWLREHGTALMGRLETE
ncbi:MAG TPA: metal-dependent hydrolase [Oribacterium sp.]|nr:metal-dependent hydrolase [Oribacterium sp.]